MKRSLLFLLPLGLALAAAPATGLAQNTSGLTKKAGAAAAGITVQNSNGQTVVVYQGREVFKGKTTGRVVGKAKNVNGVAYAAAFDGDKVIWENVKGAGNHVK